MCSPTSPLPHIVPTLHTYGPHLCTAPWLCAQGLTGPHLRLRHVTQHIPNTHEQQVLHSIHPLPLPGPGPYEGEGESPANLWDLLSQQDGKPQADRCGLRGPTPSVGSALPPASSNPQSSTSTERHLYSFQIQISILCTYIYNFLYMYLLLNCLSLCLKGYHRTPAIQMPRGKNQDLPSLLSSSKPKPSIYAPPWKPSCQS